MTQSNTENEILKLSQDKFRWKTEGKIELVEDCLTMSWYSCISQRKDEWIGQLRSRRFVYNAIEPGESSVKVYGNTAVLVGKSVFRVKGGSTHKLVYTEVYTKKDSKWKLVNLHTCSYYD